VINTVLPMSPVMAPCVTVANWVSASATDPVMRMGRTAADEFKLRRRGTDRLRRGAARLQGIEIQFGLRQDEFVLPA
jgi:hypothetical protein